MEVRTPINVRYADTDMMGVVYHANYLLYFEDGRNDFLEKAGYPYSRMEAEGYMGPIYQVELQYGAPLHFGDEAFVLTKVIANNPTKTTYLQRVYRADMDPARDRPLVTGRITACLVERETFKPVSIKRSLPELYELYQSVLEPEA